jgi:hypothetical protein
MVLCSSDIWRVGCAQLTCTFAQAFKHATIFGVGAAPASTAQPIENRTAKSSHLMLRTDKVGFKFAPVLRPAFNPRPALVAASFRQRAGRTNGKILRSTVPVAIWFPAPSYLVSNRYLTRPEGRGTPAAIPFTSQH